MEKPVAGSVVVLPFPHTDLTVGKRRPALVVADLPGDDLILCQITSQARHDGYSVSLAQADFAQGSLDRPSYVRPNRLFTGNYSGRERPAGQGCPALPKMQSKGRAAQPVRPLVLMDDLSSYVYSRCGVCSENGWTDQQS